MSLESFKSPEKPKIPSFTTDEWKNYCSNTTISDEDLQKWMAEKGIKYDSGMIEIELDGKKEKMVTSKDDFGTISSEDKPVIKSGY